MSATVKNPFGFIEGNSATIVVTAPTGSTVTCTTPSGVVKSATESSGTWTFNGLAEYGTYVINASKSGSGSRTQNVLIDACDTYNVSISYTVTLTITGSGGSTGNKKYGSRVTTNGTNYSNAATVQIPINSNVDIYGFGYTFGSYAHTVYCRLNGVVQGNGVTSTNYTKITTIVADKNMSVALKSGTAQSYTTLNIYIDCTK